MFIDIVYKVFTEDRIKVRNLWGFLLPQQSEIGKLDFTQSSCEGGDGLSQPLSSCYVIQIILKTHLRVIYYN